MRIAQEESRHPDTGVRVRTTRISLRKGLTGGLANNNGDQRIGRGVNRGGNSDSSERHGGKLPAARVKTVCHAKLHVCLDLHEKIRNKYKIYPAFLLFQAENAKIFLVSGTNRAFGRETRVRRPALYRRFGGLRRAGQASCRSPTDLRRVRRMPRPGSERR